MRLRAGSAQIARAPVKWVQTGLVRAQWVRAEQAWRSGHCAKRRSALADPADLGLNLVPHRMARQVEPKMRVRYLALPKPGRVSGAARGLFAMRSNWPVSQRQRIWQFGGWFGSFSGSFSGGYFDHLPGVYGLLQYHPASAEKSCEQNWVARRFAHGQCPKIAHPPHYSAMGHIGVQPALQMRRTVQGRHGSARVGDLDAHRQRDVVTGTSKCGGFSKAMQCLI